ncbi:glycogen/starch synthase, partial [Thiotrichales bacterium HSG1]|nr:glycogen/starch synthase [Thiotrichales bacterium HSG1]
MNKLRVLFVTSEAYPLIKTGGLGDVCYSLPNALRQLNVDVRLLLPGYSTVIERLS